MSDKSWMPVASCAPCRPSGWARRFASSTSERSLYACNTTMGVMGISPDDLMDGVERVGAPAFLDFAAEADVQLFI